MRRQKKKIKRKQNQVDAKRGLRHTLYLPFLQIPKDPKKKFIYIAWILSILLNTIFLIPVLIVVIASILAVTYMNSLQTLLTILGFTAIVLVTYALIAGFFSIFVYTCLWIVATLTLKQRT